MLKKKPENHFFSFSSGLKTVISLNLGLTRGIYTPVNTQTDRDREIKWVTFLFHDKTAPIKKNSNHTTAMNPHVKIPEALQGFSSKELANAGVAYL